MTWIVSLLVVLCIVGAVYRLRRVRTGEVDDFESLLSRAVDAFRLGDGEEGEELLQEMAPHLQVWNLRVRAAQALMRARAWDHALALTEESLQESPEHAALLRMRALLHAHLQHPHAFELLHTHLKNHPKDEEALFVFAEYLLALRKFDRLEEWLKPFVDTHPKSIRGRSLWGRALFHDHQLIQAHQHLIEAQRLRAQLRTQEASLINLSGGHGAHFGVASEELWEEQHDALLLEQIAKEQHEERALVHTPETVESVA